MTKLFFLFNSPFLDFFPLPPYNDGLGQCFIKYDPFNREQRTIDVFLADRSIYNKCYHCPDLGVSIPGFDADECQETEFFMRQTYISKHFPKEGLKILQTAIINHCMDTQTEAFGGEVWVGREITPAYFFYNDKTKVLVYFDNTKSNRLWSFWRLNDRQIDQLLSEQKLKLVQPKMETLMKPLKYDPVRHSALLEKQKIAQLVMDERIELNALRIFISDQLFYNNRKKYLELIDECLNGNMLFGGVLKIRYEIHQQLDDLEEMGEALKEFEINPKSKDFMNIETNLFMLFEFCNDEYVNLTEEDVLKELPLIREQILAYE